MSDEQTNDKNEDKNEDNEEKTTNTVRVGNATLSKPTLWSPSTHPAEKEK